MADANGTEKPSLGKIYKRQRAQDRAQQTTGSKVISGLFPLLLIIGIALHGKASNIFTIVCGAGALILLVVFIVLMRRRTQTPGAGSPPAS
jgi:hypothetical protein